MITIRFVCDHEIEAADFDKQPLCPTCGESRIVGVRAPAPRFTGICEGPNASFVKDIPAINVKDKMLKKEAQ